MLWLAVIAALLVGGRLGGLTRRGGAPRHRGLRTIDTPSIDAQAGFHNMNGGP